jgi:outer membrane receptor protein involved in Fe transport
LGYVINYTYTDSAQPNENRNKVTGEILPLPNLSTNSANLIVFYEWAGFGARLAYNKRDESLKQVTFTEGLPLYVAGYDQLDLSLSYQVNETITFTANAINLTDNSSSEYIATPSVISAYEKTGVHYSLGMRAKF